VLELEELARAMGGIAKRHDAGIAARQWKPVGDLQICNACAGSSRQAKKLNSRYDNRFHASVA
jgi:hypothetical protein